MIFIESSFMLILSKMLCYAIADLSIVYVIHSRFNDDDAGLHYSGRSTSSLNSHPSMAMSPSCTSKMIFSLSTICAEAVERKPV